MKRVVVTGMAGMTSLGCDWETIVANFRAQRSGIRRRIARLRAGSRIFRLPAVRLPPEK